jgi:hypothetical protein
MRPLHSIAALLKRPPASPLSASTVPSIVGQTLRFASSHSSPPPDAPPSSIFSRGDARKAQRYVALKRLDEAGAAERLSPAPTSVPQSHTLHPAWRAADSASSYMRASRAGSYSAPPLCRTHAPRPAKRTSFAATACSSRSRTPSSSPSCMRVPLAAVGATPPLPPPSSSLRLSTPPPQPPSDASARCLNLGRSRPP